MLPLAASDVLLLAAPDVFSGYAADGATSAAGDDDCMIATSAFQCLGAVAGWSRLSLLSGDFYICPLLLRQWWVFGCRPTRWPDFRLDPSRRGAQDGDGTSVSAVSCSVPTVK